MEPGWEPAEVQAYRKLLTASSEHFNILRSAPAFSHDEHWDTQYQKVRMHTRDDTNARARVHRDGLGRTRPAPPLLPSRVRVAVRAVRGAKANFAGSKAAFAAPARATVSSRASLKVQAANRELWCV